MANTQTPPTKKESKMTNLNILKKLPLLLTILAVTVGCEKTDLTELPPETYNVEATWRINEILPIENNVDCADVRFYSLIGSDHDGYISYGDDWNEIGNVMATYTLTDSDGNEDEGLGHRTSTYKNGGKFIIPFDDSKVSGYDDATFVIRLEQFIGTVRLYGKKGDSVLGIRDQYIETNIKVSANKMTLESDRFKCGYRYNIYISGKAQ